MVPTAAKDWGGAISNRAEIPLTISGTSLVNNAAENGGELAGDFAATAAVTGSSRTYNLAMAYGGEILNDRGSVSVAAPSFDDNSAGNGGAIYTCYGGTISATGVTHYDQRPNNPAGV